ncbi:hypothetical protein SUDANB96_03560 [Streptomyces sp. enrichment culture]
MLLFVTGAAVLRIALFSELYLRYVQPGLRPYLVASGVLLVLLGAAAAVVRADGGDGDGRVDGDGRGHGDGDGRGHGDGDGRGHGDDDHGRDHDHGHDHGPAGPRVAWLLVLPALALLLFPPPALGSYSAEREAAREAAIGVGTFPELPAGDPVELGIAEFGSRAVYDKERSLSGRTVRLTGFVTHGEDGVWYVNRLLVSCCAADAVGGRAEIRSAVTAPPEDTWVTVTGSWRPEGAVGSEEAWPPVLEATSVRRVAAPSNPYEKR